LNNFMVKIYYKLIGITSADKKRAIEYDPSIYRVINQLPLASFFNFLASRFSFKVLAGAFFSSLRTVLSFAIV
jgi:hypothetical protein